jgi:hypothetical protein
MPSKPLPTITRIPVSLNEEDNQLLLHLRASMEERLSKRLSVAEIVRIALRSQAKVEKIKV